MLQYKYSWLRKKGRAILNEDAEYGAEWALYGEAVECKNVFQPNMNNWFGDNWRIIRVQRDAPGVYFATYHHFPLIDEARIEAE
jgi:hypothetical protein